MTNLALALRIIDECKRGKYGNKLLPLKEIFRRAGYAALYEQITDEERHELAFHLCKI